jgi:hypothetical protein
MMTFTCVEAAVVWGAASFVCISSEPVTGLFFSERPITPAYLPVDEDHPGNAESNLGPMLRDPAGNRSDAVQLLRRRLISPTPSCWPWAPTWMHAKFRESTGCRGDESSRSRPWGEGRDCTPCGGRDASGPPAVAIG